MIKPLHTLLAVGITLTLLPTASVAQTAGTYTLLAAGTSLSEKGFCSIGTVTIKSNKTISITTKNPLDPSRAPTFTGTIGSKSFSASAGSKKLKGTISYSGVKYLYGSYTAYNGSRKVGEGKYSMTRK